MKRWYSLRIPIAIAITITVTLVLAGLILINQKRLDQVRRDNANLLLETETRGINLDQPIPLSKRSGPIDRLRDVDGIARNFMAYGMEFQKIYNDDQVSQLDQATRNRMIAQMDDIISLNQKELQRLIEIISTEPNFDQRVRVTLLTFTFHRWCEKDKPAALRFFTQSPQLAEQLGRSLRHLIGNTVRLWTDQEPDEAIAWIRGSRDQFTDGILESITYPFIKSIVRQRPIKTFDLVNEFAKNPHSFFPVIFQNNDLSIEERTQALTRVREMAESLEDSAARENFLFENTKALVLGQKNKQGDFQTAIDTIAANQLQIDDLEFIWNPAITDLGYHIKDEQTGEWMIWLQENIPAGKSKHRLKQLLESWLDRDAEGAAAFAREHEAKIGKR